MIPEFTHIDTKGHVRMVDVSDKEKTDRKAIASGSVYVSKATFDKIKNSGIKKGNVLETARIAGIMAAKKTAELIPMCHPVNLTHVAVDFIPDEPESKIIITATASVWERTGIEMEALTAVSVAALTIYDMCKSYDRSMVISDITLQEKSGGKSGHYKKE
jgi:cyclic pyranopterin phosphate synthase